jgi:hypothetical protein
MTAVPEEPASDWMTAGPAALHSSGHSTIEAQQSRATSVRPADWVETQHAAGVAVIAAETAKRSARARERARVLIGVCGFD